MSGLLVLLIALGLMLASRAVAADASKALFAQVFAAVHAVIVHVGLPGPGACRDPGWRGAATLAWSVGHAGTVAYLQTGVKP